MASYHSCQWGTHGQRPRLSLKPVFNFAFPDASSVLKRGPAVLTKTNKKYSNFKLTLHNNLDPQNFIIKF